MRKTRDLSAIANELIDALHDRGFVIQRYDAYSTNSIYLKLDYGVSNSIRIGDHQGKKKLNYRYNIGPGISRFYRKDDQYPRFYFPDDQVMKLVDLIEEERIQRIRKYGTKRYFQYMEKNREEGKNQPGFWQCARLVERKRACS